MFIRDSTENTVIKMKIGILSGKGGTGKTLVSVNLAALVNGSTYIDCDVEEPNGHLFFKPQDNSEEQVTVKIPIINSQRCAECRKCVDFCNFNALAFVNNRVMVFKEVCHSCGGCKLLCPTNAISEEEKPIGIIQKGISENVNVISGFLNVGEVSGVPIIRKLIEIGKNKEGTVFIDCPPGSACTAMESIREVDYCVLVAEPTLFGVHNLNIVYELVKLFKKPFGVILNKCSDDENPAKEFCKDHNINILGSIPFEKELGVINSNGLIAVHESEKYRSLFKALLNDLILEVQRETVVNP